MSVSRSDVLRLYKSLLTYSRSLTHTDPGYFRRRVLAEFRRNSTLTKSEDIRFAYKKGEALLQRRSVV